MQFWKLLDHSWCSKFLLNNYKVIDNSIVKDTLEMKIFWTRIKMLANSFIKTWVNIMKQKLMKMSPKLSVAKRSEPALPRSLHQIDDISLIFRHFFFFQTNLVFKFNPVFSSKLDSFRHNLFTFLYLLIIDILRNWI